jgi:hypothetical protein
VRSFAAVFKMVALNPAYAPSKTLTRPQNRVGDFFWQGADCAQKNRLASRMATKEKSSCGYKTASGRTFWLSKDPIQEEGGLNLYAMVGNAPLNLWDYLGMQGSRSYSKEVSDAKARGREQTLSYINNAIDTAVYVGAATVEAAAIVGETVKLAANVVVSMPLAVLAAANAVDQYSTDGAISNFLGAIGEGAMDNALNSGLNPVPSFVLGVNANLMPHSPSLLDQVVANAYESFDNILGYGSGEFSSQFFPDYLKSSCN